MDFFDCIVLVLCRIYFPFHSLSARTSSSVALMYARLHDFLHSSFGAAHTNVQPLPGRRPKHRCYTATKKSPSTHHFTPLLLLPSHFFLTHPSCLLLQHRLHHYLQYTFIIFIVINHHHFLSSKHINTLRPIGACASLSGTSASTYHTRTTIAPSARQQAPSAISIRTPRRSRYLLIFSTVQGQL